MAKAPAIQFYIGDWMKDPKLSMCSPASRGVWIDLICAMHELDRSGEISGAPIQLARICRCSVDELSAALGELQNTGAADIDITDTTVTITNRRMARESEVRDGGRVRQARLREKGGGDPDRWAAIRVPILRRDGYMCAYCGRRADTVDHVTPKSKGGSHDPDNLVACCKRCNMLKGNRTMAQAKMTFWEGYDASHLNNTKVTPPSSSSSSSSDKDITSVFRYWQDRLDHADSILTEKRKQLIRSRLDEGYSVDQLKQAIEGCLSSEYHQGKNDGGKVYDGLELICRSGEKVEQFIGYLNGKPKQDENRLPNFLEDERAWLATLEPQQRDAYRRQQAQAGRTL